MMSEHYLREKCAKAIAARLAKTAHNFVDEDMVACAEKLTTVQADFNDLVDRAASRMMSGR
jgi:hypothetical protein